MNFLISKNTLDGRSTGAVNSKCKDICSVRLSVCLSGHGRSVGRMRVVRFSGLWKSKSRALNAGMHQGSAGHLSVIWVLMPTSPRFLPDLHIRFFLSSSGGLG